MVAREISRKDKLKRQEIDLELIKRFRSGDKSAFNELYDSYKWLIYNYIYHVTNNRAMAEDLTQETMVKVYTKIQKYRPTGKFFSWIYTIARNITFTELRKNKGKKALSLDKEIFGDDKGTLADLISDDHDGPYDELCREESAGKIKEMLDMMPEEFREVLILRFKQDLSYSEIAGMVGCSENNVATRVFRAKKMFIKILKKQEGIRNEM